MDHGLIALLMFSSMMLLLLTGKRVFGAIGFVAAAAALLLWGDGGAELPFSAAMKLMKWYPLLTLPMFVFMGYMLSESGIAEDLYKMFHVWMGPLPGGLAIGTIFLMVAISAMNGLSVAGMAIGASIALPELLRRGYDKIMITGVIQAGSSLGILIPPSVVLVLYGMIARQPVGQLWLAGAIPGLMMAGMFMLYIAIRCRLQPQLGPALSQAEREQISMQEKLRLLSAGLVPVFIFLSMTGLFLMGYTSLVESSAVGALAATLAALVQGRLTRKVMEETLRKTLGISCMFMWIILAALCFGAVFDGLGAVKGLQMGLADKLVLSKVRERFGGRIRFFISGSAALNQEVAQWFNGAGLTILEGYGMTETSSAATVNRPYANKAGTVGWPLVGTEVKIAEDGEVLMRGPGIMQGYHNNPEATAETLDADGWLHSGDIGEIDERGFLKITDRKKDLFKTSNGKYVAPSLVESTFKGLCPYVGQILVHGEGKHFVTALVTLDEEAIQPWAEANGLAGASYQEIVSSAQARDMVQSYVDELNKGLNKWERVGKFTILGRDLSVEDGELTPSLKLRRKVVSDKFKGEIDGMYAG